MKKVYIRPAINVAEIVIGQGILDASVETMKVNDEYSDSEALSKSQGLWEE